MSAPDRTEVELLNDYQAKGARPGMSRSLGELKTLRTRLMRDSAYTDAKHPDHQRLCADIARMYDSEDLEVNPSGEPFDPPFQGNPNDQLNGGGGW